MALIVGIMYLPMSWATASTVAVVTLSAILIASLKKQTFAFKIFTHPKVVYIGLISYSLYLWHWGVLSISHWTIGIHWWSVPFQVALMLGLAICSYTYIATPLRIGNWFRKRWKTLVVGMGVLITLSMNLVVLGKPLKGKLYMGNRNNKQYNDWNMKIYRETKITHSPTLPTIYLIGDSHAGHYGAVMTYLAGKKEFNFVMHPQGNGLKLIKPINKKNRKENVEYVLAPLREYKNDFKKGDVVIFSAKIKKYNQYRDWTKLYETFLRQTQKIGIKFILISPTPTFSNMKRKYNTCQEEWYRPSWIISPFCFGEVKKSEWLASNAVSIAKIEQFLLANPKVSYIDAFSIICPDSYCKNHDQNKLNYKDSHHLTSESAMELSNAIETLIRSK